jgi:Uma2 family endonuclease
MTSIQSPPKLSLAEFLQLPETKPANEYIDEKIYKKPMPKGKHSAIQTFLAPAINQVGIPKKAVRAFTELRCTFGGRSIIPDITVFSWQRIPLDANGEIENTFEIAPDWAIEILSPEQSPTRVIDKILFCLNHGTELGWLIDPQERLIIIFKPEHQPEIREGKENLPILGLLEDWQISVQDVFSCLTLN